MTRGLAVVFAILLLANAMPTSARAQGAIVETLGELKNVSVPPAFRGALPTSIDLSSTMPPVGFQGTTGSCASWGVTYAAASQALRRAGLGPSIKLSPSFTYNQ